MSKPGDECAEKCFYTENGRNNYTEEFFRNYPDRDHGPNSEHWNHDWKFCPLCGKPALEENK
jgi:hypothetical protein